MFLFMDKDLESHLDRLNSHLSYLHSFVFPQDIVSLRKKRGGGQIAVISDGKHVSSESTTKHSSVHSYARSEWEAHAQPAQDGCRERAASREGTHHATGDNPAHPRRYSSTNATVLQTQNTRKDESYHKQRATLEQDMS